MLLQGRSTYYLGTWTLGVPSHTSMDLLQVSGLRVEGLG